MIFGSDQQYIYGMFLCLYGILTKIRTYPSFELNVECFVIFWKKNIEILQSLLLKT